MRKDVSGIHPSLRAYMTYVTATAGVTEVEDVDVPSVTVFVTVPPAVDEVVDEVVTSDEVSVATVVVVVVGGSDVVVVGAVEDVVVV